MFAAIDIAELEEVLFEVLEEFHLSLGSPPLEAARPIDDMVASAVDVLGADTGSVVVSMSRGFALSLGSLLLATDIDDLADDDLHDAVGELTNLLAGGVKSLVDYETFLGTPEPVTSKVGAAAAEAMIEHALGTFHVAVFNQALSAAA